MSKLEKNVLRLSLDQMMIEKPRCVTSLTPMQKYVSILRWTTEGYINGKIFCKVKYKTKL